MVTYPFSFKILHQSRKSRARVGQIVTPHGVIDTPNFVAVGTNATLKGVDSHTVATTGLQLMFCNTYHLMVQPGTSVIKNAGGLHKFMNRSLPLITDSGGFQVFSLAYGTVKDELKSSGKKRTNNAVLSINEEGILFRSYKDGTQLFLTPESCIAAQKDLGADIIIPLDELPPYHIEQSNLINSLHRTHRWEQRSLEAHRTQPAHQAMYAVIHGGIDKQLRAFSCAFLSSLPFDGFAIGGSLGKTKAEMLDMLTFLMPQLPEDKPNHLLGIGDLYSIEQSVQLGIDTFDSSHPTKCARHGLIFTQAGPLKIMHQSNREAFIPIDATCNCVTCTLYTRSYIHHLFKAHEVTGYMLASLHNISFMVKQMSVYRQKILSGDL